MTAATAKAQIFTTEDTEAHRLYREILVISFLLAWPQTWEISVVEFPFALLPESAPAPPARFAAQPAVCGSSPALPRRCGRAARRPCACHCQVEENSTARSGWSGRGRFRSHRRTAAAWEPAPERRQSPFAPPPRACKRSACSLSPAAARAESREPAEIPQKEAEGRQPQAKCGLWARQNPQ